MKRRFFYNNLLPFLPLLGLYPFFLARKRVPFEIKALMALLIYACGIILLGGRGRYFIIMIPSMVLFSVYVYTNCLKITLVKPREEL